MNEDAIRSHQFPLLWLLLVGAVFLAGLVAVDQRLAAAMFAADRSYLCIVILILFACCTVHAGAHTFGASRELERARRRLAAHMPAEEDSALAKPGARGLLPRPVLNGFMRDLADASADESTAQQTIEITADRLRAPVELGWYLVDILIRAGLLGTIVGFILIFASLGSGPAPTGDNIQTLLLSMSGGMGTALYTTLLGLITATFLGAQYMILSRLVEELIGALIRLSRPPAQTEKA